MVKCLALENDTSVTTGTRTHPLLIISTIALKKPCLVSDKLVYEKSLEPFIWSERCLKVEFNDPNKHLESARFSFYVAN